jgi:hypothetical protein
VSSLYGISSPAIADVDGDSQPEIIIGSYDRRLYALKVGGACSRYQVLWNGFRGNALRGRILGF